MDAETLARFTLPEPYRSHAAIARDAGDERAQRINSVIPSVVRQVNLFRASLRPRELHSFDLEDVLQELWLELMSKDHYFDGRSKYITFALMLCNKKLGEIRNRWHTVAGPRDTAARLRRDDGRGAAAEKVRRTVRETSSLAAEPIDLLDTSDAPEEVARRQERADRARDLARAVLARLSKRHPQLRLIVRLLHGIDCERPFEIGEIAETLKLEIAQVVALRAEADAELVRVAERMRREEALDLGVA